MRSETRTWPVASQPRSGELMRNLRSSKSARPIDAVEPLDRFVRTAGVAPTHQNQHGFVTLHDDYGKIIRPRSLAHLQLTSPQTRGQHDVSGFAHFETVLHSVGCAARTGPQAGVRAASIVNPHVRGKIYPRDMGFQAFGHGKSAPCNYTTKRSRADDRSRRGVPGNVPLGTAASVHADRYASRIFSATDYI